VFIQTTHDDWTLAFEAIKVQCSHVAISLIREFEAAVLQLGIDECNWQIIYLQCWFKLFAKETIRGHLTLAKI
jgi:hypothetical protein